MERPPFSPSPFARTPVATTTWLRCLGVCKGNADPRSVLLGFQVRENRIISWRQCPANGFVGRTEPAARGTLDPEAIAIAPHIRDPADIAGRYREGAAPQLAVHSASAANLFSGGRTGNRSRRSCRLRCGRRLWRCCLSYGRSRFWRRRHWTGRLRCRLGRGRCRFGHRGSCRFGRRRRWRGCRRSLHRFGGTRAQYPQGLLFWLEDVGGVDFSLQQDLLPLVGPGVKSLRHGEAVLLLPLVQRVNCATHNAAFLLVWGAKAGKHAGMEQQYLARYNEDSDPVLHTHLPLNNLSIG